MGAFALNGATAAACPMCKDAAPADGAPTAEAAVNFNPSIGIMLAATAGVAATIGRAMYKAARSANVEP